MKTAVTLQPDLRTSPEVFALIDAISGFARRLAETNAALEVLDGGAGALPQLLEVEGDRSAAAGTCDARLILSDHGRNLMAALGAIDGQLAAVQDVLGQLKVSSDTGWNLPEEPESPAVSKGAAGVDGAP